jgi:hypothetical protein
MALWRPRTSNLPDEGKMRKLIDEMLAQGTMIDNGGWFPDSPCTTLKSVGDTLTVTDGPFTEAKEVIAGFCIMKVKSKEEATELAKRFIKIAGEGVVEMRPLEDAPSSERPVSPVRLAHSRSS